MLSSACVRRMKKEAHLQLLLLSGGLKLANMHLQYSPVIVPFFSVPYTLKITQIRSEEPKSILIQIF